VGDGEQLAGLVDELEPREAVGAERGDRQLDAAHDLRDQRVRHRDGWQIGRLRRRDQGRLGEPIERDRLLDRELARTGPAKLGEVGTGGERRADVGNEAADAGALAAGDPDPEPGRLEGEELEPIIGCLIPGVSARVKVVRTTIRQPSRRTAAAEYLPCR